MTAYQQAITAAGFDASSDPQAVFDYFSEVIETPNQTEWTYSLIGEQTSAETRRQLSRALLEIEQNAVEIPDAALAQTIADNRGDLVACHRALSGNGYTLSAENVGAFAGLLGQLFAWEQTTIDEVLSLGVDRRTRYQREVGSGTLTLAGTATELRELGKQDAVRQVRQAIVQSRKAMDAERQKPEATPGSILSAASAEMQDFIDSVSTGE